MNRFLRTFLLLFASVQLGSGPMASEEFEIYTCRDERGNISMQNDPCPEVPEKKVAPQPVAPPRQKPKPAPKPKQEPKPAASLPHSRTGNSWIRLPSTPSATRSRRFGKQTFPTRLEGTTRPAGPSYLSPAQTWRTFLAAIESGDSTSALACLTADARETLGPDSESFPLEEIRSMVGSLVRIEDKGNLGPFWSIYGAREGRQPKWIFFEQVEDGSWKIAAI